MSRKIPECVRNYYHPKIGARLRKVVRFPKEDFMTLDAVNQRNSKFLCNLIQAQRIETTAWTCTWTMKIGQRVLDLAFKGRDDPDAYNEIKDILFLRYHPHRQYHVDKLYNELVPQLEYVETDLMRYFPLKMNEKKRLICVMEFANNGLPALPFPEESFKGRRRLTYPEVLELERQRVVEESGVDLETVTDVSDELIQLLPHAQACAVDKKFHTLMDIEGSTLMWQRQQMNKEITDYAERVRLQAGRNSDVSRGETLTTYKPIGFKPRLARIVPKKIK